MNLKELLKGFPDSSVQSLSEADLLLPVTSITADSREVGPGAVFVAIRGTHEDGHKYIPAVQQAGAALIVGEDGPLARSSAAPYVQVKDAREALARLAANFYGNPSHSMKVIGVTGTSGKTTTTYLVESILIAAGHEVGVIGTVNFRHGSKIIPSSHTTPGAVELQRLLAQMKSEGCSAIVMEVSSHALKQHRTAFIEFDGMIFTNLSPEHLDYHPDMEDYFLSKSLLFTSYVETSLASGKKPVAAINDEDSYGQRLLKQLMDQRVPGLGIRSFRLNDEWKIGLQGVEGILEGTQIRSPLVGRFNGSNILGAITLARGLGIDPKTIARGVANLNAVPGRLERVPNKRGLNILVDYAHKPDALEKVLHTLREMKGSHRLITVFGCGGDRDRKKRPVMGKLAAELSDYVVITSDNPRTENPQAIINEILAGIPKNLSKNLDVEPDRRKAIGLGINNAQSGDIVLIAGKGHEDYQILGKTKVPFDDRLIAAEFMK